MLSTPGHPSGTQAEQTRNGAGLRSRAATGCRDRHGPAGVGLSGRQGQDSGSLTPEAGRVRPQGEAAGRGGTRAGLRQAEEVSEPAGQRAVRGSGVELYLVGGRERPRVSSLDIEGSRGRVLEGWGL